MDATNSFLDKGVESKTNIIPASESDVSSEWFHDITGIPILLPNTFEVLPNANSEVGNLSKMVRVGFMDEEDFRHCFMIKLLPVSTTDSTQELRSIVTSENMNGREVFFYASLKVDLERLVPELGQYFVQCYKAVKDDSGNSLLILQDLTPDGFLMPSFSDGLSDHHFTLSLDFITKFHFAGELLQEEHGGTPLPQVYPALNSWHVVPKEPSSSSLFNQFKSLSWFPEGLQFVANHVLGNSPAMSQDFLRLIPHAEKIIRFIAAAGSKFPTVIHDDLWPHNFLYRGFGDGLKVIDWQLLGYTDPCYDLASFILASSPIQDINRTRVTNVLQTYYKLKEGFHSQRNLGIERSWRDFESFFDSIGLGYGLVWFAMSADSIHANPNYRPKLYRIFEFLWEASIPQFLLEKVC